MKNYLYSLVLTAIGGGVACILAPDGEKNGLRGRVGFVVSLLLLLTLISPIMKTVKKIENYEISSALLTVHDGPDSAYEKIFGRSVADVTEKAVKDAVCSVLSEDFDLDAECFDVGVQITETTDAPSLDKITVFLSGTGLLKNPRRIEAEISEYFACTCEVIT